MSRGDPPCPRPPSSPADADVLCGTEPAGPGPGLALVWLRLEPALRCAGPAACSPCLQARLRLAVEPGAPRDGDNAGDVSPSTTTSPLHNVSGLLLLSSHSYASSRCVAVEVWAPLTSVPPGRRRLVRMARHGAGWPRAPQCVGMWGCGHGCRGIPTARWFSCPGLGEVPVLRGAAGLRAARDGAHQRSWPPLAEPEAAGAR